MFRLYSRALIVADDFTGCCDTALQFSKVGYRVAVTHDYSALELLLGKYDVISVSTNTRSTRPLDAYEKVSKVLKELPMLGYQLSNVLVYKKVDSALRGNVVYEVKAVYDVLRPDLMVFAPAYPRQGRITRQGVHLINNVPVSETYFGRDPASPVRDSYIPSYFNEVFDGMYRHVFLDELRSGLDVDELRRYRVISSDIEIEDDFRRLIPAILNTGADKVVWIGSAGLAEQLVNYVVIHPGFRRPVLMCLGSPNDVLRRQVSTLLRWFEGSALVHLGVKRLLRAYEVEFNEVRSRVYDALGRSSKVVVVASALLDDEVVRGRELIRELGLDASTVSYVIADSIGRLCASLAKELSSRLSGLLLCGGDVALATFRHLTLGTCEVVGEVEPGLPILKAPGLDVKIATKAGGFGDEWTLVRVTYRLSS